MDGTDGVSTLIEAARFIETGEPNSSCSSKERESKTDKSKKGCLRNELQSCGLNRAKSLYTVEELRQDHNRLEKLRRRDMRCEFDDLRNKIPSLKKGKHSNVTVLQSALEYINELKELEISLKTKQHILYDKNRSLKDSLANLEQKTRRCTCSASKSDATKIDAIRVDSLGSKHKGTRKRTISECSTVSADSPKMFLGDKEEDLEMIKGEKILSICKGQYSLEVACTSPVINASVANAISSTSSTSRPSSLSTVSPNSEVTLSIDSGFHSAAEKSLSTNRCKSSCSSATSTPSSPHMNMEHSLTKDSCNLKASMKLESNRKNILDNIPVFKRQTTSATGNKIINYSKKAVETQANASISTLFRQPILTTPRNIALVKTNFSANTALKQTQKGGGIDKNKPVPFKRYIDADTAAVDRKTPVNNAPANNNRFCNGISKATVTPITIVTANPVKTPTVMFLQPVKPTLCQHVVLTLPKNQQHGGRTSEVSKVDRNGGAVNSGFTANGIRLQRVTSQISQQNTAESRIPATSKIVFMHQKDMYPHNSTRKSGSAMGGKVIIERERESHFY